MTLATLAVPLALAVGALVGWSHRVTLGLSIVIGAAVTSALWLLTDPLSSTDRTLVFSTAGLLYVGTMTGVEQLRGSQQAA
ncbi:MAG TPA: hypothetical protein VGE77_01400 [Nocardioides sp.]